MRAGGPKVPVCIRNVSPAGMIVEADTPPSAGTYIEIIRQRMVVVGRVVRARDRHFEIVSRDPIDVAAIIARALSGGTLPERQAAGFGAAGSSRGRQAALDPRERAERNRSLSAVFEFAVIGACGVVAAVTIAGAVYGTLSQPFDAVSSSLANAQ
jgi:hypothetical protein